MTTRRSAIQGRYLALPDDRREMRAADRDKLGRHPVEPSGAKPGIGRRGLLGFLALAGSAETNSDLGPSTETADPGNLGRCAEVSRRSPDRRRSEPRASARVTGTPDPAGACSAGIRLLEFAEPHHRETAQEQGVEHG